MATPVLTVITPAREALSKVNAEVVELHAVVAASLEPITKLQAVSARLAGAEAWLAAARGEDDRHLSEWLAALAKRARGDVLREGAPEIRRARKPSWPSGLRRSGRWWNRLLT
jgi:hypothetical protein